MSNVIAVVKTVVGQVMALSPDGVRRLLVEGDRLFRGEQVQTGEAGRISLTLDDGQTVDLGRASQWPTPAGDQPAVTAAPAEAVSDAPSADELQQAIAAGADPTTELPATAAGANPGTTSGGSGIAGGHGFVMLDATAAELDPQVGFETRGLDFAPRTLERDERIDDFVPAAAAEPPPIEPEPEPEAPEPPVEEPEPPVEQPEPPVEEPEPPIEEPEPPVEEPEPPVTPPGPVANTPPVAVADSYTLAEGGSISGNLLSNDFDADGDSLVITGFTLSTQPLVGQPLGSPVAIPLVGTLQVNANGSFSFTPLPNYHGPVPVITYTISDGSSSASTTVSIDVTPVNDPPFHHVPQAQTTPEDTPLTFSLLTSNALGAFDVDLDTLTTTLNVQHGVLEVGLNLLGVTVSGSGTGTLVLTGGHVAINNAMAQLTYTPDANYHGPDTLTISSSDGQATATDSVAITVTPVNDPPLAAPETNSGPEDSVVSGNLLTHASDVDGDALSITGFRFAAAPLVQHPVGTPVQIPLVGTLRIDSDGTYTFTPLPNYNGTVPQVIFTLSDGTDSASSTLDITITPVNDAPTTSDLGLVTDENVPISSTVTGADIEGDTLSFTTTGAPSNGSVVLNPATGAFTYTPNAGYNGPDSFVVTVSDGNGGFATSTVTIGVNPLNDAPVSVADSIVVAEGGTATVLASGATSVLANDSDADGDLLSAILVSGPANGTLTLNPNGTFSYTHNGSETTADSFTYRANDGTVDGNIVTVSIGITPVNDAPQAVDLSANAVQGGAPVAIALSGSDPDIGDVVDSFRITSLPDHGTLQINGVTVTAAAVAAGTAVISATDAASGLLTYLPPGDFDSTNDGPAPTFGYQAFDGDAYSAEATVTVNVADAAPVAVDDFVVLTEGSTAATVNLVIMLDTSATMVSPFLGGVVSLPGGGTTTRLALAQKALENLITSYGGSLQNVMLVTFDDNATYHGWFNDPAAAIAAIRGVATGIGTNFDDALRQVQANYGTPPDVDHTYVYFLSDGYPATPLGANRPSVSISSSERDGWVDFLTDKGVDSVYAVGIGSELVNDYAKSNLDTVAWSPSGNPPLTWNTDDGLLHDPGDFVQASTVHNANTLVVVNPLDLNGVLQGTVQIGGLLDGSVSGNIADDFGADGAAAQKIVAVSLDSDGDGTGDLPATFDGDFYQLDLGADIGLLKIDAHSGNYSFNPVTGFKITQDVTFKVLYTIADGDGSQATATLHLTLESGATGGRMAPLANGAADDASSAALLLDESEDTLLIADDAFDHPADDTAADSGLEPNQESIDLSDLLQEDGGDIGAYIAFEAGTDVPLPVVERPLPGRGGDGLPLDGGDPGILPAAIINSLVAGADPSARLDA